MMDRPVYSGLQLDLPGVEPVRGDGLLASLERLEQRIDVLELSREEQELLRRFRSSDAETRRLIIRLLAP